MVAIGTDSHGCLRTWLRVRIACPSTPAGDRIRIPLWEPTAGSGTEDASTHGSILPYIAPTIRREAKLLQIGACVRVDFRTQRDLDDLRGFPGHMTFSC